MPPHALTPRLRGRAAAALGAVLTLTLAACGPATVNSSSEPQPSHELLAEVDPAAVSLPAPLSEHRLVDPGWATAAKELDGVFLAPRETEAGALEYLAVDARGEVLWTALRPPSCTGFVLTTTEHGQAIAVLTDQAPSRTRIADPVASAYDLRTGAHLWGPTPVTGPYKGPGLVFAAPPAGFMGDVGEKVALDPASGEVVARESALAGARIIGEYHGAVLTIDGERITARDLTAGAQAPLWELPLAGTGWDPEHIGNASRHHELGPEFLSVPSGEFTDTVIDARTGRVVSDGVTVAARDPRTGTLVTSTEGAIHGFNAAGERVWEVPRAPSLRLVEAGAGLVFLRDGERNTALLARDGSGATEVFPARVDAGPVYLPSLTTPGGAAVVEHGAHRILATSEPRSPGADE